jgi:hypothetical protein
MTCDLSPGDAVHFGNAVSLTVLAIEGDLIHFKVESPERDYARPGIEYKESNLSPQREWWNLN